MAVLNGLHALMGAPHRYVMLYFEYPQKAASPAKQQREFWTQNLFALGYLESDVYRRFEFLYPGTQACTKGAMTGLNALNTFDSESFLRGRTKTYPLIHLEAGQPSHLLVHIPVTNRGKSPSTSSPSKVCFWFY